MADRELEDGNEIDRDDADMDEVPYDKLMAMLGDDEDGADDVAFGPGASKETPEKAVVSVEDGLDLIEGALDGKRKAAKVDDAPADDTPADDAKPDAVPKDEAKDEAKPDDAPDAIDTLLTGLDDTARTTVKARITAADEVLSVFKGREAELQAMGMTPQQAMAELVKVNSYARSKPGEYLAWAATQFGDPAKMLGEAAEKLGMKLVANTQDDDPFEDPETKAMKAELAAYKARESAPTLGPDAPHNQVANDLQAFKATAPHFEAVAPQIAALAQTHVQTSGKPATMADIKRFYDAAVMASGLAAAPAPAAPQSTLVAQPQTPVAQTTQKTTAAPSDSVQRAKAASRSLDGSGQGAGRRPAIAPDASLDSVLSTLYDAQAKG